VVVFFGKLIKQQRVCVCVRVDEERESEKKSQVIDIKITNRKEFFSFFNETSVVEKVSPTLARLAIAMCTYEMKENILIIN
jgi:hypothetical protein